MQLLSRMSVAKPVVKVRFHPQTQVLAALLVDRDRLSLWRLTGSGTLDHFADLGNPRQNYIYDFAFHPNGVYLALAGRGQPIEIWSVLESQLVTTVCSSPGLGESSANSSFGGYDSVIFAPTGKWLVASQASSEVTEVYHFEHRSLSYRFWRSDTTFAFHPEGDILVTPYNEQLGSGLRFVRSEE